MRVFRRLLITAASALAAVSAFAGTAAAAPSAPHYDHYVALGDSYTAGPLIPFTRLDPLGCVRSTRNYPSLLADTLDVRHFHDISCSGAKTSDMTGPQSVPFGHNPAQFSALRPDTDLVTLGIGGNDGNVFGNLVGTCPKLRSADPTGNPCQRHFTVNGVDQMKAKIAQTQQRVTRVLAGIHKRSPEATVLVVGYPRIVPAHGYCPNRLPFANGDYAWTKSVEVALNNALQQAVSTDGDSSYVDTYTPSAGHSICATGGAAWINGKNLKLFAAAPYHPFENAMRGEASIIADQLGVGAPVGAAKPSRVGTATPQQLDRVARAVPAS